MAGDHHVKSREWGPYEPGTMPCERSHLRFFYASQVWRRRSSRNIIRTPSDTNTLPKEPHRNTIHTGNSGSLSALAKRFSSIRTRGNVSMLLREPCRATIPTRSSESLSALTSCVPASSVALLKAALGMPLPSRCLFIYLLSCHALTKAEIHWADIPRASSLRCRSFQLERQPTHPA